MPDGFEDFYVPPAFPGEQMHLGPREQYEVLDSLEKGQIEAVEAALDQMRTENPQLSLWDTKTARVLYEKTGASRGSIGMALFIASEGMTVADFSNQEIG